MEKIKEKAPKQAINNLNQKRNIKLQTKDEGNFNVANRIII